MQKRLLWLILIGLLLGSLACGEKDNDAPKPSPLQLSSISSSLTIEENRFVLAIWDGENRVADAQSVALSMHDLQAEGNPVVWEGNMTSFSDYEVPYWVAYPEFPHSGPWLFDVTIKQNNGATFKGTVAANVYEKPIGISIGDMAPTSQNRIWDGSSDLKLITSDPEPEAAYYQKTIAEALTEDKPLVVVFSTPGLCASKLCAPVMRSIKPLWTTYGDRVNFIHVEVYEDFETLSWVSTMNEWQLQSEPWVYIINAEGVVSARLDGPVAPSELEPLIEAILP